MDINSRNAKPTKSGSARAGGMLPEGNGSDSRSSAVAQAGSIASSKGEPNSAKTYKAPYKSNTDAFKPNKGGGVR